MLIVTPPGREDAYVNRKGYYSINTQIVCDYDLVIRNVVAKYPGSTHDAFIWRNSRVSTVMSGNYQNGDVESKLLGDSGYPLLPWLMVPYSNPRPASYESAYNDVHTQARNCVERCIGLLKGRWRCLLRDRTLHYRPPAACRIIMACAVLHNIAIMFRVEEPALEFDEIDFDPPLPPQAPGSEAAQRTAGQRARDEYARHLFH